MTGKATTAFPPPHTSIQTSLRSVHPATGHFPFTGHRVFRRQAEYIEMTGFSAITYLLPENLFSKHRQFLKFPFYQCLFLFM
jgi:hypothetical protein